jgi:tetratricopeptide (TPR) repeat protein
MGKTSLPINRPLTRHKASAYFSVVVAVVTFIVFLPALKNAFLAWDDVDNFVSNTAYRGFGWQNLRWMFTTYHMGPYQPLSWLSNAIDFQLWGANPMGFHLTNVLLQSLNAVLFFFVGRRLLALSRGAEPDWAMNTAAAAAALFFAIHPLRVESVAWASERRDVLSGCFFLLSALAYLRRASCAYRMALIFYLLALLSKATSVGLVWVLIACDIYPLRRLPLDPRGWFSRATWPVWREKIPFVLLGAAAVANGIWGLSEAIGQYALIQRLAFFLYGIVFYVEKTIWPGVLSPLYEISFYFLALSPRFWIGVAFMALISGFFVAQYRKFPVGLLAWICYLLILMPVSGLAQNGPQIAAARYSYLACMPWAVLLGAGMEKLLRRANGRRLAQIAAAAALAALGISTWRQTHFWKDDLTLWSTALAIDPQNSRAHNNYGAALAKQNRMPQAMEHYRQSLALNPSLAEAYRDIGLALASQNDPQGAIGFFQKAESIRPGMPEIHVNMAAAYYQLGKFDETIAHYQRALELHTRHEAEICSNLALAYMMRKNYPEAIVYYERARAMRPDLATVRNNLATALAAVGRTEEAVAEAREAIRLNPNYAKAHFILGGLLKQRGERAEAEEHFQAAERLGLRPG